MAKTKKQAVVATTASARRSEAAKTRGENRVDGPTDNVEKGDETDSGSGRKLSRRAARRDMTNIEEARKGKSEITFR